MSLSRAITALSGCALLLGLTACTNQTQQPEPVSFEWKATDLNARAEIPQLDTLLTNISSGTYGYIDEIFIAKGDSLIFHQDFGLDYKAISKGKKNANGCGYEACADSSDIHQFNYLYPDHHPYFNSREVHTLQSVTKSIVATVVGIAVDEKHIPNAQVIVEPFFEEYSMTDEMRTHLKNTTLEDLLTMRAGIEWHELGEDDHSVVDMEAADDWISYVLAQSVEAKPGTTWEYSSGVSQLFSGIVKKSVGITIKTYADEKLFSPMGIRDYHWKITNAGLPDTEGGLYMKIEDLAKFGLLYINDGRWNGEQLVSEAWIKSAWIKHAKDMNQDGGNEGYGYQWWITGDEKPVYAGLGFGGQILMVLPEKKLIGVVYSWNVFDNESKYIFRDLLNVLNSIE